MKYIVISLILIVSVIIIFPLRLVIKYDVDDKNNNLKNFNSIKIYILKFLKIKTIRFDKEYKGNRFNKIFKYFRKTLNTYNKSEVKIKRLTNRKILYKLNKGIDIKKLDLDLGFNVADYILNSYLLTLINIVLNMYIAANIKKFENSSINVKTYITANTPIKLKIYSIVDVNLVNTIIVILNILIRMVIKKIKRRNKQWKNMSILLKT